MTALDLYLQRALLDLVRMSLGHDKDTTEVHSHKDSLLYFVN